MSETFSEEDLQPSADEKRRAVEQVVDRLAATVAIVCTALVVGGMVALGACAAPAVFRNVPDPLSGAAMGTAFSRFDTLAMGASAGALGAEMVRTFMARRQRPTIWSRIRRFAAFGLAGCAAMIGLSISPSIKELYEAGARRGQGELGARLEQAHKRAETLGGAEIFLGALLIGLHVFTLRGGRDEEEYEQDAVAPAPPGPSTSKKTAAKEPAERASDDES